MLHQRAVACQLAQQHVEHGREEQAKGRHPNHPGEHGHTHGAAHFCARTGGQHQGQHAHHERQRGHQNGAQTQAAGLNGGLHRAAARKLQLARKLHDQDRVLGR